MSSDFHNFVDKTIGELVQQYVNLRDELTEKRRYFDSEEVRIKELLGQIESTILQTADSMGVDSFKTPSGTAFKTSKTHVQISDWDLFSAYIVKHGATHLVQKRVAKNATLEELDAGEVVPGIEVIHTTEIQVRK